jgi:Ca-activated chloride channel family protein
VIAAALAPALPASFTLLGESVRLAEPRALRLLAVVAVLAALGALALARRRAALRAAAGALAGCVAPGANAARPALRLGLWTLGLALLAVALARPQCGTQTAVTRRSGVDLVVVLDASRSMLARDVLPDRLARAKLELGALLEGLPGHRVGLVAFAGSAYALCPLTSDHAAFRLFLRGVDAREMPDPGTAVGEALLLAGELLEGAERGARSRAVLLVTDGEDHEGGADGAARALADQGARLFTLAVGTAAGGPIPLTRPSGEIATYLKDRSGETVVTRLDAGALARLATAGDGAAFLLGAAEGGLPAFAAELERMEKTELEGRTVVTWSERYGAFALAAFVSLLAALLVREARPAPVARRTPEAGR